MKTIKLFSKVRWLVVTCLMLLTISPQILGATFTVNSSTTSSDALFSVSETMTNYTYSTYWTASDKLIDMATSSSITVTNVTGATITAISVEGVAQNNSNKTVNFTGSDGTTSAVTSSGSWNNRKSSSLTSKALNSTNVNKFKCDAGQTYTLTNNASSSYAAGVRFVITYTSTLPTSLTNGATTSSTQALSWTAPSTAPANGYLVAYSSSTSTAPGNSVTSTTGSYTVAAIAAGTTSTTLSELSESTTYNWWVRSKNARGNSSWVAGSSFTTESGGGGCAATADAGADKATTYNTGVAMAATAATSGYTGAWSISSGPSTSTSQLSSTSAYNATFTPNAVGTYTLIWTVTDDSDGTCSDSDEATVTVSKADMPTTGLATGTASSITATGATLPFTMTSTSGVGSLTIKVYNNSTDALVKTYSNITPTTNGSQAVTGLSASTTYYYKITPVGDANHNDGSETGKSSTFTTLSIPTHSVTAATSTGDNSKGTVSAGSSTVAEGSTTTITASPAAGYKVTNWAVSGTGASISPSGASNSNTTTLTMGTADATVTVTFGDASYGVTYVGSGRSKTTGGSSATHGTDFTATFTQNNYYTLRSAITVTIGGNTATQGTEYSWSISNGVGTVTIDGDYITGAIVITVNADANRYDVTLTYDDDEITKVSGATGTNAATYYSNYTATFRAKTGYVLQDDISVTIGGNSATKGSEYSWSVSEGLGTFSVSGSNVIGAIVAEVDADVDDTDYEITYAAGVTLTSGDPPSPDSEHKSGEQVEVLGNTGDMVYTGYTFRGWTDGTTFYRAGDKITIAGADVALTAVWDGGTSCTEYELLASSASLSTESSTAPKGHYITGIGKVMKSLDGASSAGPIDDVTTCHGSAKGIGTGSGIIALQTYNAINKVTIYGIPGGNRTLSSIKTATALNNYSSDIQSSCDVDYNLGTKNQCGEMSVVFPNTLAANSYIGITLSGNISITGVLFENCVVSNFTVSFNMKGHGSQVSSYVGVPTGKKIVAPTEPEATGYTFGGWYRDNSCSNAWNWGSSTVTQDTTIYAKWTPKQYSINYYDQGGSAFSGEHSATPPTTHTYGTATTLKNATKSCYTFGGWYTSSDCSTGLVTSLGATAYTADINLYAKWTLTLDVTADPEDAPATVGKTTEIAMTATGASTYQWQVCDDDEGTNATNITGLDTEFSNYDEAILSFTPGSADTYYLRCKITDACSNVDYSAVATITATEAYDITMGSHTNGSFTIKVGSASAVSTNTESGAGATIAIVATPSSGYVFKKWEILKDADDSDITTTVGATATSASTSFTMPSYDVTINAVFVATHTLTVSVSGGVGGSVSPTSTTVGETLTQSISATPGTGYNFTSWEVSGTGSTLSSTTTNPTTFTMGTANATVTATFSAKTYGITLNRGIGTSGSTSVTMTYNSSSHTAITAPSVTGYTFAGWYTGEGGTGSMVMNASGTLQANVSGYTGAGGVWTKNATCTLYAKFTANYPDGYLYITDVMATPETKAGYTIAMSTNSATYNATLGSTLQTNRAGYEYWADATGSSGYITLSFSGALAASANAGGMIIDVWWGADNQNRTTSITLNGGDAVQIDAANSSTSDRNIVKKATYNTELKSLSSVKLSCNGSGTVWFRIGIKDRPGYLLTYDDGDGSGAPSASYQPNATITLSETVPTRSGYVFLGWQIGGEGDVYAPGDEFDMPAEATTLVAKWVEVCYSIDNCAKGTMSDGQTSGTIITYGGSDKMIKGTISGGTLTYTGTGGATLNGNAKGLIFNEDGDELTVAIEDAMLQTGTLIVITAYGTASTSSHTNGFKISGNSMSPASVTSSSSNNLFTQTYEVIAADGVAGGSSFTIKRVASTDQVMFYAIQVAGCTSCTAITPSLSYSATTLYAYGSSPSTATPNLTGNTGGGSVSYSSSNTSAVTVNTSTGVITAVGAGTATITATIAAVGDYCGANTTCDITVASTATITQAINTTATSAWGTQANLAFAGADASHLSQVAVLSNTGYSEQSPDSKAQTRDGRNMSVKFKGSGSSSTLSESKYFSLQFTIAEGYSMNVGRVVVPVQPVSKPLTAAIRLSDTNGTTINPTASSSLAAGTVHDVTFDVSGKPLRGTVTLKVFFYNQNNEGSLSDDGFRFASPLLIYGDFVYNYTYTTAGNWSTAANWNWGLVPLAGDNVVLQKPVTVDNTDAVANNVVIDKSGGNTGKLTIAADGMLIAAGTIRANGDAQTAVEDVVINTSKTSQGALIFDNPSGSKQTKGTVNFYTRSYRDNTSKKLQWQYVGVPFDDVTDEVYGGLYVNKYSETAGSWTVMRYQGDRSISAWDGLALAGDDEGYASISGTFTSTEDKDITLTYSAAAGENLIGNSWTAPIQIADLEESDFGDATATIYLFNTGRYKTSEGSGSSTESGTKEHTAGQWMTIPIASAATGEWEGMKVIPAFQGFEVITSAETTLSLDYSKVVASATNAQNAELHAPARRTNTSGVDGYRIRVSDEQTRTDMYLFEHNTFSEGFDNGWDGDYMPCDGRSAQLYAQTALGKLAVAALPDLEGTVLGFKPGQATVYTFSFGKTAGNYYLNDLKMQESTLIQEGNTYTFNWEDGDSTNRFIISASPYKMPTGIENGEWMNGEWMNVKKVLIDDHLYIIRAGKIFDATGGRIK